MEHEKSGVLVLANEPYTAASFIYQIFHQWDYAEKISRNVRKLAAEWHDKTLLLT